MVSNPVTSASDGIGEVYVMEVTDGTGVMVFPDIVENKVSIDGSEVTEKYRIVHFKYVLLNS